jgi:hypothetical protein
VNDYTLTSEGSDRGAADIETGQEYWLCRHWLSPRCNFERVRMTERRRARWSYVTLTGPHAGEEGSVFARELLSDEDLPRSLELRERDLRIAAANAEHPVDGPTADAIDVVETILVEYGDLRYAQSMLGALRRLGWDENVEASLHPAAYIAGGHVHAPVEAFRKVAEACAAAEPQQVGDRVSDVVEARHGYREDRQATIERIVRRWAGLPPQPAASTAESSDDEVVRLRALVEHAANLLDEAGRADDALNLRKAAFPHRFRGSVRT